MTTAQDLQAIKDAAERANVAAQARADAGKVWAQSATNEIVAMVAAVDSVGDIDAVIARIADQRDEALARHAETIDLTKQVALDLTVLAEQAIDSWPPPGPTFGHPVYTQAQVDKWSTKSPEYSRLASSWAGNVNRTQYNYGTAVSIDERDKGLKDMGVWAKTQAVLARAELNDGTTAQRTVAATRVTKIGEQLTKMCDIGLGYEPPEKCFALDGYGTPPTDNKQHRLVLGWCLTNYCQAASLVNYRNVRFDAFLRRISPLLYWTGSSNWQASFDDSFLAVAVYLKDQPMYEEAKKRFYHHLASQVYHPTHDGTKVAPLHKEDGQNPPLHTGAGTPNVSWTVSEWGYIESDMTARHQGVPLAAGSHTEDNRDLGHVQMAHGAHVHSCRTILAQGDVLEPHAHARVLAALDNNAKRVLYNLKNPGKFQAPIPVSGDGGGSRFQAWWGAKVLFGSATPASVTEMLGRSEVKTYAPAGANHMVAEAFADAG